MHAGAADRSDVEHRAARGRFAPSPTGDLHVGNLRTATMAWLSARSVGGSFLVRMEDLDRAQASAAHEGSQLDGLRMIGLDWDGDVVRQSDRFDRYTEAIDRLAELGLVYECYCTRSEIRAEIAAAPQAPHGPPGSYPGTCRDLSEAERRRHRSDGRPPALRLRSDGRAVTFRDRVHGETTGVVDDVVLRRNDGVPAYNLAVVVDDAAQGITEVVRGDDLLSSTPRQIALQQLLGLPQPEYVHVPLVVDDEGRRLAKRRGEPVTLGDLAAAGIPTDDVVAWIGASLGRSDVRGSSDVPGLVDGFDVAALGTGPVPWTLGRTRTIR